MSSFDDIVKIYHIKSENGKTGATAFVFDKPLPASTLLIGSAPATREIDALNMGNSINVAHALLFNGSSAFGLDSCQGLLKYQKERGVGVTTAYGVVPICPAACIYDLGSQENNFRPVSAEDIYEALRVNNPSPRSDVGSVGCGIGASVSKFYHPGYTSYPGGFGYHCDELPSGIKCMAFAVVNAFGDIIDRDGKNITGPLTEDGKMASTRDLLRNKKTEVGLRSIVNVGENTTLAAIFVSCKMDRQQLNRICKASSAAFSRCICPSLTCVDGDIIFAFSTGEFPFADISSEMAIADLASECLEFAIRSAISRR